MQIDNCKLQIESRRATCRGITLVELLVAISILVLLMAVGARMVNFSADDRRTREAARAFSVYLSSARNRALESGRSCGVMLHRDAGLQQSAVKLDQVEVPPPYAGETLDATAQLWITSPAGSPVATVKARMRPYIDASLVEVGDRVQFNHQGPFYEIVRPLSIAQLTLQVDVGQGQTLPWPRRGRSAPMPYQIIRRPRKSAASTLELPVRAVVDLEFSGTNAQPMWFRQTDPYDSSPITIMFSPNGTVDRVYLGTTIHRVVEPVFLLVGKRERVLLERGGPSPAEDERANWEDTKNFWVTLNPQTGLITTAEVAQGTSLAESREIAREGQSMGGR